MKWIGILCCLSLFGGGLGCDPGADAEYLYAENLTGWEFMVFDESEGVHPSRVTLENSNNPFYGHAIGAETKWAIQNGAGNVAAFYGWATLLAQESTGEHQYYAASALAAMLDAGEVDAEERGTVRAMAIAGFQALLDHFPESLSYTANLTSFRLDSLAYDAIIALNGSVNGGWVKVEEEGGGFVLVQQSVYPEVVE